MRLIKMSKDLFPTRVELISYFEDTESEFRTRHDTFGIFMFTKGRIAPDGVTPGETLLFSYDGEVTYVAKAASGPLPSTGSDSDEYPYCLQIELPTLRRASIPLIELEKIVSAKTGKPQSLSGQGWTQLPDDADVQEVVDSMVKSSTNINVRYQQLEPQVRAIVDRACPAKRISVRSSAEKDAANIIMSNLGTLTSGQLAQVLKFVDKDLIEDKERSDRFGLTFLGANTTKICSNIDTANEVIKELWLVPETKIYSSIDRLLKEKPVLGAGTGFYSLIPYLRNPLIFNIWIDATILSIGAIENRTFKKRSGDDYCDYNAAVNAFRDHFQLAPQSIDSVLTRLYREVFADKERIPSLETLKNRFIANTPGFVSFVDPGEFLLESELNYKRNAVMQARELLESYIAGTHQISDEDGRELAQKLFKLTNFLNWRDQQYIGTELLDKPGRWSDYWRLVFPLLKDSDAGWEGHLSKLLSWLGEIGCKANISKLISTYPLFLWNPSDHFFIKPSLTDTFLKSLKLPALGDGKSLTLEGYKRVIDICSSLKSVDLVEWLPQDNVDIHTFIWMTCAGESKAQESGFWWVNQGASFEAEYNDGYIFAPLHDERGASLIHWDNLAKVRKGDAIFHYADQALRAVSIVSEEAVEVTRPSGSMDGKQGRLVRCSYSPLKDPVFLSSINQEQRVKEGGPFNKNGGVKQGYLFPVSEQFAEFLAPLIGVDRFERLRSRQSESEQKTGGAMKKIAKGQNKILYGPPGTGKTFLLQNLMKDYIDEHAKVTKAEFITELVRNKTWWEVAVLVLLDLKNAKLAAIMQHELVVAKIGTTRSAMPSNTMSRSMYEHAKVSDQATRSTYEPIVFKRLQPGEFELIEEKVSSEMPEILDVYKKYKDFSPTEKQKKRYKFITFHQSYGYEDFIEGLRPKLDAEGEAATSVGYSVVPGVFKEICTEALQDPSNNYALFIDEINRGNISKIFGELITLIELDKRVTPDGNGLRVRLPYSADEFGVPENLSIIGTMNTADRSIAFIDIALRRRFQFEEMMPNPDVIRKEVTNGGLFDGVDTAKMLETINRRIEFLYDRDHMIGHSFFLKCTDLNDLKQTLLLDIIPLIQEYFYGDWEKISLVLGCGTNGNGPKTSNKFPVIKAEKLVEKEILGFNHDDFDDCYRFEVHPDFKKATGDLLRNHLLGIYQLPAINADTLEG